MEKSTLTKRQQQIYDFILSYINKFDYPPSIPEIQEKFYFKSPNAVQDHLEALKRKGYISRRPHKSRGIKVLNQGYSNNNKVYSNVTKIPIIGRVSAGTPILAEENIEGTIFIDKSLIGNNREMFVLKVKGTSMINACILDGDFILVCQQSTAEQGEIVVVLIEDEATVKRFYRDKDKIRLQPENDIMEPIIINNLQESNIRIIGKVEGLIRKL